MYWLFCPTAVSNKQTKPAEDLSTASAESMGSSANVTCGTATLSAEADSEHLSAENVGEGKGDTGDQLQESYEDVSQHGDIDSPPADDKGMFIKRKIKNHEIINTNFC